MFENKSLTMTMLELKDIIKDYSIKNNNISDGALIVAGLLHRYCPDFNCHMFPIEEDFDAQLEKYNITITTEGLADVIAVCAIKTLNLSVIDFGSEIMHLIFEDYYNSHINNKEVN